MHMAENQSTVDAHIVFLLSNNQGPCLHIVFLLRKNRGPCCALFSYLAKFGARTVYIYLSYVGAIGAHMQVGELKYMRLGNCSNSNI